MQQQNEWKTMAAWEKKEKHIQEDQILFVTRPSNMCVVKCMVAYS